MLGIVGGTDAYSGARSSTARPMAPLRAHPTPNPNSLKFTLAGARFLDTGLRSFSSPEDATGDPLGSALFAVRGISNVFVVPDFVTVTKHPAAHWDQLMPSIERILTEYATGSEPAE